MLFIGCLISLVSFFCSGAVTAQQFPGDDYWINLTYHEIQPKPRVGSTFTCPNSGPIVEIEVSNNTNFTFTCAGGTNTGTDYSFEFGNSWQPFGDSNSFQCNGTNSFWSGVYYDSRRPYSWWILCNYLSEGWTFHPINQNCYRQNMITQDSFSLLSLPLHNFIRGMTSFNSELMPNTYIESVEYCVIDIVRCDKPKIRNGYTSLDTPFRLGTLYDRVPHGGTIDIFCNQGYYLRGSQNNITCLTSGEWTKIPKCKPCSRNDIEYCNGWKCSGRGQSLTECSSCELKTQTNLTLILADGICASPPAPVDLYSMLIDFDPGDTVHLPCDVVGFPDPTANISWFMDPDQNGSLVEIQGHQFIQQDNGTLLLVNATISDIGLYVCRAANVVGEVSLFVYLYIFTPYPPSHPRIEYRDFLVVGQRGTNVLLPCNATGFPEPTIRWYYPGLPKVRISSTSDGRITQYINGSLGFHPIRESDEGTYICHAENQLGWTEFAYVVLVCKRETCSSYRPGDIPSPVDDFYYPPIIYGWTLNTTIYSGDDLNLHCNVKSNPIPSVFWLRVSNTHEEFVSNSASLDFPRIQTEDAGVYKCIAVNWKGVDTAEVNVTVLPVPITHNTTTPLSTTTSLIQPFTITTGLLEMHDSSNALTANFICSFVCTYVINLIVDFHLNL